MITRKIENVDNVIPSANSEMAINLFLLGNYFYEKKYIEKSEAMLEGMIDYVAEHTSSFANWFQLYLLKSQDFYEIAIVGSEYADRRLQMAQNFIPNAILLGGAEEGGLELLKKKHQEGKTMIYVCKQKSCKLPVEYVELALKQIE